MWKPIYKIHSNKRKFFGRLGIASLFLMGLAAPGKDRVLRSGPYPASEDGGIRISLFPISGRLDPRDVETATQYVILSHLVRNLVYYNSVGDIEGDLATSWSISRDFRTYKFSLVRDALFSDGSPIRVSDVVRTIRAQMKAKVTTQFDFGQIQSIDAIGLDSLQIILKASNPNFISQLVLPEFGVLHRLDVEAPSRSDAFNPSSGPYFLVSASVKKYVLHRNPFYPHFIADAPGSLTFEYISTKQQLSDLSARTLDFSVPLDLKSLDSIYRQLKGRQVTFTVPHIGFTYWLSLNPHSPALRDLRERNRIQSIIHRFSFRDMPQSGIPWARAEQLYLPDGVGRPTRLQVKRTWRKIERNGNSAPDLPKIRILTSSLFPFNADIARAFHDAGIKAEIEQYDPAEDVSKLAKTGHYDAFLINNDFSSVDLLENILTTFNAADPLIFLPSPDHPIARWVKEANSLQAGGVRHALFQKISLSTLEDGLVAPLCYRRIAFLHQRTLDISAWSSVFPEIAFWKARRVTP